MNDQPAANLSKAVTPSQRHARTGFWVALVITVVLTGIVFLAMYSAGGVKGRVQKILGDVRWEEGQSRTWQTTFSQRMMTEARDLVGRLMGRRNWQGEYYHQEQLVKLGTNAVPELLRTLAEDSSTAVRRVSALALGQLPAPGVLTGLTNALLNDPEMDVREAACSALGDFGDVSAIPALLTCLRADSEPSVRAEAAGTLGQLGGPERVPDLIAIGSRETNDVVRVRIAMSLGDLPDVRSIPLLTRWLNAKPKPDEPSPAPSTRSNTSYIVNEFDGPDGVAGAAAGALGHVGGEDAFAALMAGWSADRSRNVRVAICEALGATGDARALPVLLEALRGDGDLKQTAIGALGNLGSTNAVPALLSLLSDSEKEIRQRAATALGVIGSEAALGELTRVAKEDSAEEVRAHACGALGDIGNVSAQPVILETAAQIRKYRSEIAWALGHVGDSNAVPMLAGMLGDADSLTRFAAAYALAEIGGPGAVEALATRLTDQDEYARHSKACALAMLGCTNGLPTVRDSLRSGPDWRRFGAALALIRLGDAVTADEWLPLQSDRAPALREFAGECARGRALPALTAMLSHRGKDWRHYTARGMIFFNEPSTLPALRQAGRDADPEVRHAAQVAVRCIERRTAIR